MVPLDRSQPLFYFVPQEKVILTVKLARLGSTQIHWVLPNISGQPEVTGIPRQECPYCKLLKSLTSFKGLPKSVSIFEIHKMELRP